MWIFLSGPMGAGKSTVARLTAAAMGLPHYDLDRQIETLAGKSIHEIFTSGGEAAFRELEASALSRSLRHDAPGVLALGGGTAVSPDNRRTCFDAGTLITLTAPPSELAQRVGRAEGRPLLAGGDVESVLRRLLLTRRDAYAEAHHRIDTGGLTPPEVANEVVRVARLRPEVVALGARSYPIFIGPALRQDLRWIHEGRCAKSGHFWVSDENVAPLWGARFEAQLDESDCLGRVALPAGEQSKKLDSVEHLWDAAMQAEADRRTTLLALGGGVIGDLTGFAAATLYRGVRFASMPTTLLAMVDSSVGGKTGFNRPAGKNLVGAFHQPEYVVCDVDTLETLTPRDYRSGLGEVVKSAWLAGEQALASLEKDAEALKARDADAIGAAIRMCVRLKSSIVQQDEREGGVRALLNLGHTVGHAIEATGNYETVLHGEAVGLGLIAAMRIGKALGTCTEQGAARCERLLSRMGLPVDLDAHLANLRVETLRHDKKRLRGHIRFVLPYEPGDCRLHELTPEEIGRMLI